MKKQILLSTFTLLCFGVSFSLQAQWTGTSATSATDNATRMGKVGIGLASTVIPGNELHVKAISPSLTSDVYLETLAGKLWILSSRDDRFAIMNSSATDYLSIINNGNIGIGTTSPTANLHLVASTGSNNAILKIEATSSGQAGLTLKAGQGSTNSATRIDFLNSVSSSTLSQWSLINDYNQNGTNDFTIVDNTSRKLTILQGGNVGIGTTSPQSLLHIYAASNPNIKLANSGGSVQLAMSSCNGCYHSSAVTGDFVMRNLNSGSGTNNMIFSMPNTNRDGNSYIKFGDDNELWVAIYNNYIMRVDGTIKAKKVQVTANVWADDEFVAHTQTPTLAEEEAAAIKEQHLIGVPAEAELKAKGLDLGEMQAIQMRKIEQLYKHLFALSKENEALKAKVEGLEKQLKK